MTVISTLLNYRNGYIASTETVPSVQFDFTVNIVAPPFLDQQPNAIDTNSNNTSTNLNVDQIVIPSK